MNERLRTDGGAAFELPDEELGLEIKREIAHEATESTPLAKQPISGPVVDDTAPADPPMGTPTSSSQAISGSGLAVASDDTAPHDLEKQYVDRAKSIIDRTRDDPHNQQEQIGHLAKQYRSLRGVRKLGTQETT